MPHRSFVLLLAFLATLGTSCKESRDDLNRSLVSAGLPFFSDEKLKKIDFGGRKQLPVHFGNEQSEAAGEFRRACCSADQVEEIEPLSIQSIKESGVYRAKVADNVFIRIGAPFDGIKAEDLLFLVHAKCSEHHFVFAALNHDEVPALYADPMALCRATAP